MNCRLALTLGLALMASAAMAHPNFVGTFKQKYPAPAGSALAKATCAICHVGFTPKLNPYGVDLQKALRADKTKTLSAAELAKVEKLDSDKDGAKNIVEIKAGTLPGDAKSKPGAVKPKAKAKAPKKK
ncbi:MAG TPA: hypothetical protein VGM51_08210 [Armatimonadota bacterium]|jgi:hypothetical protein